MDAGNGDHFTAFTKIFNKFFLVLCLFCLWTYEEHPEDNDHCS